LLEVSSSLLIISARDPSSRSYVLFVSEDIHSIHSVFLSSHVPATLRKQPKALHFLLQAVMMSIFYFILLRDILLADFSLVTFTKRFSFLLIVRLALALLFSMNAVVSICLLIPTVSASLLAAGFDSVFLDEAWGAILGACGKGVVKGVYL
jgi:hypothetical protein